MFGLHSSLMLETRALVLNVAAMGLRKTFALRPSKNVRSGMTDSSRNTPSSQKRPQIVKT
jgi:hypothetical protein